MSLVQSALKKMEDDHEKDLRKYGFICLFLIWMSNWTNPPVVWCRNSSQTSFVPLNLQDDLIVFFRSLMTVKKKWGLSFWYGGSLLLFLFFKTLKSCDMHFINSGYSKIKISPSLQWRSYKFCSCLPCPALCHCCVWSLWASASGGPSFTGFGNLMALLTCQKERVHSN